MKLAISKKNLWEQLPQSVKNGAGRLIGLLPPELLLGRSFREWKKLVSESSAWTKERVQSYQIQRLKRILMIASDTSDYYREIFDSVGFEPQSFSDFEDLQRLPFSDKRAMKQVADSMSPADYPKPNIDYVSTGGTSGKPFHFYIGSDRSAIEYAHLTEAWSRAGYSLTTPQAVLRGQVIRSQRNGMHYYYDPLLRRHNYSNFHMDDQSMAKYVEHIRSLGPCYIQTYPSTLSLLVRFLDRSGIVPPANVQGLLVGSENVYADDRAAAENMFDCRYLSWYGHSEKLILAAECEHSSNYHVYPTYGYCELIDEKGEVVTTLGTRGELVGTGFINEIMPFIRYRTGDYATYLGESCEHCGRNHKVIGDIRGHRTMEMLVASDGTLIPRVGITPHDDTLENVLQIQFVQSEIGKVTLKVVPVRSADDISTDNIEKRFGNKLEGRIQFNVEIVDAIELTDRGKSINLDQKLNIEAILMRKK